MTTILQPILQRRRAAIDAIEQALDRLRSGGLVLLRDDESRENEGDVICAADHAGAANIAFMATHARGLVCQSIDAATARRLNVEPMVARNTEHQGTAFTVSVDAATGITTGISAADRARTVAVLTDPASVATDLVRPGHLFPLVGVPGGVFRRRGHTEASIDLARLSGCTPSGVICEVLNDDGTMARGQQLEQFATRFDLPLITIEELIIYRESINDIALEPSTPATLPTEYGDFEVQVYRTGDPACAEVVLLRARGQEFGGPQKGKQSPLVRLHSECLTGEAFGSNRCDCGAQLQEALRRVGAEGGVVLYLRQEGRGIGLFDKIRAYTLQDQGHDTLSANLALDHPADARRFGAAAAVLRRAGIDRVRLLTDNPEKIAVLQSCGVEVLERLPWSMGYHHANRQYRQTKIEKMGHLAS